MLEIEISDMRNSLEKMREEKNQIQSELATAEIQRERELIPGDTLYPGDNLYPTNIGTTIEQLQMKLQEISTLQSHLKKNLAFKELVLRVEFAKLDKQKEQTSADN